MKIIGIHQFIAKTLEFNNYIGKENQILIKIKTQDLIQMLEMHSHLKATWFYIFCFSIIKLIEMM